MDFLEQLNSALQAQTPGKCPSPDSPAWQEFLRDHIAPAGSGEKEIKCIANEVCNCTKCPLAKTRLNPVPGEGDPQAKLMFIGEGPGADEDASGRPFVGRAGQLLDKMISAMQFKRGEVYITNIVKCRPPGNRTPTPEEADACREFVERQIQAIAPEVIVLLGASAAKYLLDTTQGITTMRGHWKDFKGIPVMPTYHPAYLLRQESAKKEAWLDLQQVMAKFGKYYRKK